MLTREESALLTLVGPATPMGELMRRYWIPALLSAELVPAGRVKRVRLLGEDLVAFRAPDGTVGLLGEFCSHRGASLYFGRNEAAGLRCVYHGWKYGADGQCVDMPNEPPASSFTEKVRHPAYPCAERGGVVWTYMGPTSPPPALPELEWALVPDAHRFVSKFYQECNYLQALEGGIDPRTSRSCTACSTRVTRRCATWTGRRPGSPWPRSSRRRRGSTWSTRRTAR